MTLSAFILKELGEIRQEARRDFIKGLLMIKFGSLDEELSTIVEPLSRLTPDESLDLLLKISREELLNKFSQP